MSRPTQKRRPASGRLSWGICCRRRLMVITDTPVLWPHRPAARLWNGSSSPGPCICPTRRCVKCEHTHTHTHSQTAIFSMHSQIPFARSQWITCCPMVPAHKSFFPSFTSPLLFFLLSSPAPLLIKPKLPTYSTLLGRKRKPITCTKMTLRGDSCTYVMMFVSDGSCRVFNKVRLRMESHYHAAPPDLTVVNINYY